MAYIEDPQIDLVVDASAVRHKALPHLSATDYLQRLMVDLGLQIEHRKKIYLDSRYWILLREAALDRPRAAAHTEMLAISRALAAENLAVFPVSDASWMELSRQTDDRTRLATADLFDQLSLGITLQSRHERTAAEIEQFLVEPAKTNPTPLLKHRVWLKAGYILGVLVPHAAALPADQNLLLQKTSIDLFWSLTHRQMAERGGLEPDFLKDFEGSADRINEGMRRHDHEVRSIQQAFAAESAGILSVYEEEIREAVLRQFRRITGDRLPVPSAQAAETGRMMLNGLCNAFRLRPKVMAQRIPTVYSHAMCHAAVRMDRKRKFNANDLRDIDHASGGLPYHDAVFTETPLRVLVTAGNVVLDKTYGCTVLSRDDEILAYLRKLTRSEPPVS